MNQQLKQAKQTIRRFLQEHYSDEKLCALLAHAQSGRLALLSCCCFIGIPTADHALEGETYFISGTHYDKAMELNGARAAEAAFAGLSSATSDVSRRLERQRRLIPILKAEIRRREKQRSLGYVMKAIEADEVTV